MGNGYPRIFYFVRNKILERDNYTCQMCGLKVNLCVHHLDMNKLNNKPANLITLCIFCHAKMHTFLKRVKRIETANENEYEEDEFD